MIRSSGILISLFWIFFLPSPGPPDRNPPLFCTLSDEWQQIDREYAIGTFANKDTLLEHVLYLLTDTADRPLLFYADILTPVCIDGACKPVFIELYWDLTGAYAGYGLYPDKPLTKFDHEEFLPEDQQKLNRLLADRNSVLRRKELSDLFDEQAMPEKKIEYQGVELDAVSGATKKEIKESIVEGALYSCYTLWHLVHGQVAHNIETYLDSIYTSEWESRFLESGHEPYYFYALQRMEAAKFVDYSDQIATIFSDTKPLIRTYILKKMPANFLREERLCRQFYQHFADVDINTKTLLINHLPNAHPLAIELLSFQLEQMSKNQLRTYLEALSEEETRVTAGVRQNLQTVAGSQTYPYAYLITQWLE